MSYEANSFVADEQPTPAKWNQFWLNDAFFNDFITGQRTYIGSTVINSTGSQAITGVGFQPKAIIFTASAEGPVAAGAQNGSMVGFADEDANQAVVNYLSRNSVGGYAATSTNSCIALRTVAIAGPSTTDEMIGTLTSMDSDGFTINITATGSGRTLVYTCLR